ncbi:MAG TPA: hypothetical protein VMP00_17185, partial [Burkholderiales bacterium]|nr:hypothetical protein [Burkholderiales bacterium]
LLYASAFAQQKHPINTTGEGVQSRYTQQHVIDVGDVPGHQVRILEVHRIHTAKQIVFAGVKVVEEWGRGFSDYTNGIGPAHGYGIWILEDGNKVFFEWSGIADSRTTATGSRRGTFNSASKIVGGTGRFTKIRGMLSDVVEFDTDPQHGYSRSSSKGEYWFVD